MAQEDYRGVKITVPSEIVKAARAKFPQSKWAQEEEMKKPWRVNASTIQYLTMSQIQSMILKDAVTDLMPDILKAIKEWPQTA